MQSELFVLTKFGHYVWTRFQGGYWPQAAGESSWNTKKPVSRLCSIMEPKYQSTEPYIEHNRLWGWSFAVKNVTLNEDPRRCHALRWTHLPASSRQYVKEKAHASYKASTCVWWVNETWFSDLTCLQTSVTIETCGVCNIRWQSNLQPLGTTLFELHGKVYRNRVLLSMDWEQTSW